MPARFLQVVQIALVGAPVVLAPVTAVCKIFAEISAADTDRPRFIRCIRTVLQHQRPVAVSAFFPVFRIIGIRQRALHKHNGRVRLPRCFRPLEPLAAIHARQRIRRCLRHHMANEILMGPDCPPGNPDLYSFLQGQCIFPKQHHASCLGSQSFLHKCRVPHNPFALRRIQIRILEKAHPEHPGQKALRAQPHPAVHERRAVSFLTDPPGFQHRFRPVVASELIHPVEDNPQMTFCLTQIVHAVAPAAETVNGSIRISGNSPVRTDHAVIGVFLPQQFLQNILIVAVSNFFMPLQPADRVIRHHRSRLLRRAVQPESPLCKGTQVLVKLSGWIYRKAAVWIMSIPAAFSGSAARPVFDHGDHTVRTPAIRASFCGLHPVAVCLYHRYHFFRITAQGILQPHPPRLRGQIDLRPQGRCDAQGTVFFCRHLRKTPHQFRISGCRHPDPFRPFADIAARCSEFCVCSRSAMPRISGNIDRNAPGFLLADTLEIVAPPCRNTRALHPHLQHVTNMVLFQETELAVCQVCVIMFGGIKSLPAVSILKRTRRQERNHLMGRIKHKSGDFLPAQPFCQVGRPCFRIQPPVFIGQ